MGPKVRAATRFVRRGGRLAVITTAPLARGARWPAPTRQMTASAPGSSRRVGADRADRGDPMTVTIKFFRDTYVDSVVQLAGMRAMREVDGVEWASAAMATPANVATLRAGGRRRRPTRRAPAPTTSSSSAGRRTTTTAARALAAGEAAVLTPRAGRRLRDVRSARAAIPARRDAGPAGHQRRRRLGARRLRRAGGPQGALGGPARAAVQRQRAGRTRRSRSRTTRSAGACWSWGPARAPRCSAAPASASPTSCGPGRVGVVAAAGTGAQEAMTLLDRWGVGVSQVIGSAGATCPRAVGGRMARPAIAALRADPATEVILLVSKPPAPDVAAAVLATAGETPLVAALVGLDPAASRRTAGRRARRHPGVGVLATLQRARRARRPIRP